MERTYTKSDVMAAVSKLGAFTTPETGEAARNIEAFKFFDAGVNALAEVLLSETPMKEEDAARLKEDAVSEIMLRMLLELAKKGVMGGLA